MFLQESNGYVSVRWREAGENHSKSFDTKAAAVRWMKDAKALKAAQCSPEMITAAMRMAAGTKFSVLDLVRAGADHIRMTGAVTSSEVTFEAAGKLVIERAIMKGAKQRTIISYKAAYAVLNKHWGTRIAAILTVSEVRAYLAALPNAKGEPEKASRAYKDNLLRHIRMAMSRAGVAEPLKDFILPQERTVPRFFAMPEVKMLLGACQPEERGFVAVALFGCVRPETLEQLPADAVSVKDRWIKIPEWASKDRQPHYLERDILPDVLWKWLKLYPYTPIKNWDSLQERLKRAAGRWFHDAVRHTGATYYCSMNGISATARLLTHQGESLVKKHYAGVVEQQIAKTFFSLTPERIDFTAKGARLRACFDWPSDEHLALWVQQEPATKIAAKLGCSDSAIVKRCRDRGIKKPGRGHWSTA